MLTSAMCRRTWIKWYVWNEKREKKFWMNLLDGIRVLYLNDMVCFPWLGEFSELKFEITWAMSYSQEFESKNVDSREKV